MKEKVLSEFETDITKIKGLSKLLRGLEKNLKDMKREALQKYDAEQLRLLKILEKESKEKHGEGTRHQETKRKEIASNAKKEKEILQGEDNEGEEEQKVTAEKQKNGKESNGKHQNRDSKEKMTVVSHKIICSRNSPLEEETRDIKSSKESMKRGSSKSSAPTQIKELKKHSKQPKSSLPSSEQKTKESKSTVKSKTDEAKMKYTNDSKGCHKFCLSHEVSTR